MNEDLGVGGGGVDAEPQAHQQGFLIRNIDSCVFFKWV